jgi:hypothetical protein
VLLALACLGVPFVAGAKLLDSVRPQEPKLATVSEGQQRMPPRHVSRSRPKDRRSAPGSALPSSHRID